VYTYTLRAYAFAFRVILPFGYNVVYTGDAGDIRLNMQGALKDRKRD